jgi:branched-chain amino acid transport system substrate-binding protein
VRGPYRYGNNHFPIQNFYLLKAVAGATPGADPVMEIQEAVFTNHKDAFSKDCPMKW